MNLLDNDDITLVEENKDGDLLEKGAKLYSEGDYDLAIEYYRLSAAFGNVIAISNLGYCYYYARGVDRDYTLARAYFEIAAKHGEINATYMLGDIYINGDGVKKDEKRGVQCYVDAYNELKSSGDIYNYPDVLFRLGKVFMEGKILEQNLEMAKQFLEVAREGFKERMDMEEDTFASEMLEEVRDCLDEIKQMKNE